MSSIGKLSGSRARFTRANTDPPMNKSYHPDKLIFARCLFSAVDKGILKGWRFLYS
jgi:hypothetical protein